MLINKSNNYTKTDKYELADVLIALDDYKEATKMFKKSAKFAKTAENKVEALEAAILCLEKQIDNRTTNK